MSEECGYSEFTYTRAQLEALKRCLDCNDSLYSGLSTFIGSGYGGNDEALLWLRFAEKIKDDPNFIDSHFLLNRDNYVHALQITKR